MNSTRKVVALAAILLACASCSRKRGAQPEAFVASEGAARVQPAADNRADNREALKSLAYVGGGNSAASAPSAEGAQAPSPPARAEPGKGSDLAAAVRKLIRRVELDLVVRDTEKAARGAEALANGLGGFLEQSEAHRSGELMYFTMTLRIPEARLAEAMARLKKGADRIDREQIGTEDVTSQYVDLNARMATLKATEGELRALLAESRSQGRKVEEIMAVYRELTEIRTQIEQIEAQVRAFDRLSALSTVQLRLSPTEAAKPVAAPGWHPLDTVRSAFRSLVSLARGGVELLIFLVVVIVPVIAVLWLLFKGLKKLLRTLRRRRD